MMQMRLWQAESVDGEFEEDDVDGKDSIYRLFRGESVVVAIPLMTLAG